MPPQAVGEAERWDYRDRVCLATAWTDAGWRFGLKTRDEVISIPRCPVHSGRVRAMTQLLIEVLPPGSTFPLAFYVQAGAQVTLVLKTARLPDLTWLDATLQQRLADIGLEGLWLQLHPAAGRVLFTKNGWRLLWGQPRSQDRNGLIYGPAAFQQLIPTLHQRALAEARAFLAPTALDAVVDLYCGTGVSLMQWPPAQVIGVEIGAEAIECARQNAPAAQVLRGKCQDRIPQLQSWLADNLASGGCRLLYANPPRTGLEASVLDWIIEHCRPRRLAYLSCSAGTLRRDLDSLTGGGYRVVRITPYDFFPQTYHVETLALLERGVTG